MDVLETSNTSERERAPAIAEKWAAYAEANVPVPAEGK